MSSILKALRKLEEEKAARRDGSVDIARDILRAPRGRRVPSRRLPPAAAGIFGAAFLFLAWAGWFFWTPSAPVAPFPPPSAAAPTSTLQVPAAPAEPGPSAAPDPPIIQEVLPPEVPEKFPRPSAVKPPPSPPSAAETAVRPPAAPHDRQVPAGEEVIDAAAPVVEVIEQVITGGDAAAAPVVEPPAPGPALIVSGIAFHPDPDARLAVINDLPVMQGTVIEGMTVEEILPDRVRFSREGRSFEVGMGEADR